MGFLKSSFFAILFFSINSAQAQVPDSAQEHDSTIVPGTDISVESMPNMHVDTSLRITNLNPFFTLHVDSSLSYQLQINKNPDHYFWFLKNSPVGLRINKDNGLLSFRADKSFFLSGKLKYDVNYNVILGVQNLYNPQERIDTSITIVFYNTDIIPSRVKPSISSSIKVDEGETVSFKVLCETGSFPIDELITLTSSPIESYADVKACGETFNWKIPFDFVKDTDSGGIKLVIISFIGANKFKNRDTANIRITVRNALNYPMAVEENRQIRKNIELYILQLKYTFLQLDKRLRKTKSARTAFDLTSASTSLSGTIISASADDSKRKYGQILPSIGLSLVPIKEAAVPNKGVDQNQAALIRTSIKRLDYILNDNALIGERDSEILKKTAKLREELKQVQVQLIDVPIDLTNNLTEAELNRYFNSPSVNKKYRLRTK